MDSTTGRAVASLLLLAVWPAHRVAAEEGHSLGTVHFPVSCSPEAQSQMTEGIALLHHMTYPAAQEHFRRAGELDPRCAMAHWGIAMTLFQPLWPTRPDATALARGWDEIGRARAIEAPTPRERLYVDAAAAFFEPVPGADDYWSRIRRWAEAQEAAAEELPDDDEAAAFAALAILATAPTQGAGHSSQDRAAGLLEGILARNPEHPGGVHYLIHANDVQGREGESLDTVRAYVGIAPRNPHALHMPTHIYVRLGLWDDVVAGNLAAAEAALAQPAGEHGDRVWDEFPHAVEYLVYALLQQGADSEARAQKERLELTGALDPTSKTAFHLASIPARYALERHAWAEAASLPPRPSDAIDWGRHPWPESVTWLARGLGAAHLGRLEAARAAVARLAELEGSARDAGEQLFERNIRVERLEVEGWIAQGEGDPGTALALLRQAADLEASTPKHPVTPGPTLPAAEQLGDLLMEQGSPEPALEAYRRSLALRPNRFNSLAAAAQAADSLGDAEEARRLYGILAAMAAPGADRPALAEARRRSTGTPVP